MVNNVEDDWVLEWKRSSVHLKDSLKWERLDQVPRNHPTRWEVSSFYRYTSTGIKRINANVGHWDILGNRSYYRLRHIPTGKIIPGDLL